MSLVRFSNSYPSVFDTLFANNWFEGANRNYATTNTTLPSVNIKESSEEFEVEVAAPGFGKNDFHIELNHNLLTISSDKQGESEAKEDKQFTRREFNYQSFSRSFTLPNTADSEKIEAKYENGILKVLIPKKEEAKPKPVRMITIA
ncbi:Hsp20/alpha crystallin family protein [Microbacter margulisiae]|uniref:HSP20 family protein n=1 Tax=Microbacter margulisiae TaxID=1350067 RepID=A0A7W5DQW2_9PORP|nr:Hsp20/alpha crystallin family protein [Microbacter margulisiae]MBB3187422.1 HSP20 family protein [Microbacter margulisiae]